jgi:hypothetical protein
MKLTLAILALIVFCLSLLADYKWRQWMKKRRTPGSDPEHSDPTHTDPTHPSSIRRNL